MTTVRLRKTMTNAPIICQSRIKRDWMDATYNKHAYQCMPMSLANVYGWELQLQHELIVRWPSNTNMVDIRPIGQTIATAGIVGMISFNVGWRFKTENGYSLQISGSPNFVFSGAHPLSAILPTDWWPDEFQMNWMILERDKDIIFPKGFPFMFFSIIKQREIEGVNLIVETIPEDKNFVESRKKYGFLKAKNNKEKPWSWTKGIKTGVDADGNRIGPTFTGLPKLCEPQEKK